MMNVLNHLTTVLVLRKNPLYNNLMPQGIDKAKCLEKDKGMSAELKAHEMTAEGPRREA